MTFNLENAGSNIATFQFCDVACESPIGKVLYSRELIILKFDRSLYFETVPICFMRIFSPHSSADCKNILADFG